ncbi:hypothetical protein DWX05_02205 [Coprobacillus sp. AF18-15LB]|nr:hypothetical protein DWX19_01635 [Coprobacillus sp. AF18-40]RGT87326.1 hypothetical protein DWX05_02205 [Coprobacillus sp. AF18-15LB]
MAIGRITYEDKIDYQKQGQDDRYKVTAKDMNEIKKTFNDSAEAIERNVEETEQLQVKLDDAINRTGHYKIEDGKIYFEQIDGSFGEGIELPAQSSVFINGIVQGTINLDSCLFVLEENGGETICGDYEAYIDYLAKHQSTNEESEDETL